MKVMFINAEKKAPGFACVYRATPEMIFHKPADISKRNLIESKCLVVSTTTYKYKI